MLRLRKAQARLEYRIIKFRPRTMMSYNNADNDPVEAASVHDPDSTVSQYRNHANMCAAYCVQALSCHRSEDVFR